MKSYKEFIDEKESIEEFAKMTSSKNIRSMLSKKFSEAELHDLLNGLGFDTENYGKDKENLLDYMIAIFRTAGRAIDNRSKEFKLSFKKLPI